MVSSDANKNIVFSISDWLSFEGDTGPYLMYSFARTQSILRKADGEGIKPISGQFSHLLSSETEIALLRELYDFNRTVLLACENYRPSSVANYLFSLCKEFNRFYREMPVLKADSSELRLARLALVKCFGEVLKKGLALLGISPPDRM